MQVHENFVEVNGIRWKLLEASESKYRKLEVSIAYIETSTTSMEAPATAMEASTYFDEKTIASTLAEARGKKKGFIGSKWTT